jgi:DNA ligase-associated metallophosphoesterase
MTAVPELRAVAAEVAGEAVELLAACALYWPRKQTLLVADVHFGKAAAFRAAGVFVPEETTAASLRRLDDLIHHTDARRIVFLGDLLHAAEGRHPDTLATVTAWRRRHVEIEMVLVRGNHDRNAGDPPSELGIACIDGPLLEPPFAFVHHPVERTDAYVLAGHIHPGVLLVGRGRQRQRFACFWLGAKTGVLPAFGEFTGFADVEPRPGDRVWVVADERIFPVPVQT